MKHHLTRKLMALSLLSAASTVAAAPQFPEYSMVLVGGGLHTCSSQGRASCQDNPQFPTDAKTTEHYAISMPRIIEIVQAPVWPASRAEQRQQTQIILSQLLLDFGPTAMSEDELLQRWRVTKVTQQDKTISGETLYQQLSELELNLILDLLQQAKIGRQQQRQSEVASLAQTKDKFSVEVYEKISELASKVRQKPGKPVILVVTASSRDPLSAVDFYLSAFAQTGAEVQWLPLNAAYQAAQQQKTAGKASCQQLPQYLADIHGSYGRATVYPDLMQQLTEFCQQGPAHAVAQIQQADAIFFNGGDQSLTLQALRLADGTPTPELQAITARMQAGKLIVAGTSAGTAVQSGGKPGAKFAQGQIPMISNGSSRQALQTGAVAAAAPLAGCEKNHSCPAALAEDQLTYRAQGGLGLFPFGVMDTHFSERGREARLVRLLSDTQTRYGFGVDEATALLVGFDPAQPTNARFGVIGASGVYIADLAGAKANGNGADWQINQVRTHYLSREDQATLQNGELSVRFADWKKPVGIHANVDTHAIVDTQATKTEQQVKPKSWSKDFLADDNYRQLAGELCRSGQAQAHGQSAVAQVQLLRGKDSKAAAGTFAAADQAVNYCSYQNFYLQIKR
ncbi:cyanophycinase [Rheinheimera tilapiae]|uniref:Cyanophycinase n=1 Tax=Rheinheimera tilapiae TaxID=875043 RepID=A0ABV6BBU8_9GAMM